MVTIMDIGRSLGNAPGIAFWECLRELECKTEKKTSIHRFRGTIWRHRFNTLDGPLEDGKILLGWLLQVWKKQWPALSKVEILEFSWQIVKKK